MLKNRKGITLISLVIMIVILLILAGISITTLLGDNGIIIKAQDAKRKIEQAEDIEKINLAINAVKIQNNGSNKIESDDLDTALLENGVNSIVLDNEDGTKKIIFLDSKKIYKLNNDGSVEDTNSDFDSIYVIPQTQDEPRNEGVLGIGTDGNPVDMDLWYWTYDETTGGYALNAKEVLEETAYFAGYTGEIIDGKIKGTMPIYIKDNQNEWRRVTNLNRVFYNNTELVTPPIIPNGVVNMSGTFNSCEKLQFAPQIPESVVNMHNTFINCPIIKSTSNIPDTVEDFSGTYANCPSLEKVYKIGKNVKNMGGTFLNCSNLNQVIELPNGVTILDQAFSNTNIETAPEIPSSATSIRGIFQNCSNLKTLPSLIPESVENMQWAFEFCTNINGKIEINANVTGKLLENGGSDYRNCFRDACTQENCKIEISGSCSVLEEIVDEANNPNITLID